MKKFLKILLLLVVILLAAVLLVPVLFKDKLVQVVKDNINETVDAHVEFGDFNLTLLKDFPDFTFEVQDITVDGTGAFDSLRLASLGNTSFTLDLKSVFSGEKVMLKGVNIDKAYLNAVVLEDGSANYDIIKEEADAEGDTSDVRDAYHIRLEEYSITDTEIIYDNRSLGFYMKLDGLNHSGNGDLTDKIYDLQTQSSVDTFDLIYEDVHYLQKADVEIDADFDISDDFRMYNLKENEIRINELYLTANGTMGMPEDGVDLDIDYKATRTDLKNLLSLVPKAYMPDLEGLQTKGNIDVGGSFKGHYSDAGLMAFSFFADVRDGEIQYPELPENIDQLNMEMDLVFPGGPDLDAMTVSVKGFHMLIAESPVNADLLLKNMMSDPYIKTDIKSQLDLDKIKDAIAIEGVQEMNGIITADISLEGKISDIEAERYNQFKASGNMIVQDLNYNSDDAPVPVQVHTAHLNFTPRNLELANFSGQLGKSDIKATGVIDNYMEYYLKDEMLSGRFDLRSSFMDLNEFMTEEEAPTGEALTEGEAAGHIEVPGNVDLMLNSTIGKVLYDNIELNNVKGQVVVKDKVASLRNVDVEILGGNVRLNGDYSTLADAAPKVNLDLNIKGMDINSTASSFSTVSTLAPVAKQCRGDFSSLLNFSTELDEGMNPILSSLKGAGDLFTSDVILENFAPLVKIAEALKLDNWTKQTLNNVKTNFEFADGKIEVKPFDVKLKGIESNIGGSMSFDQQLDYTVNMKVPVSMMGGEVNDLLNGLVGQVNNLGLNLSTGDFVNMSFKVTGPVTDPKIKPSILGQEGGSVKEVITQAVKEKVEEEIKVVKEETIKKVTDEAREKADKLMKEANRQADALRAEAQRMSDKVTQEGYAAASSLEAEAKNPFAKLAAKTAADKVRKETDEKAKRIVDEANSKATSLVERAQAEADKLLE